MAKLYIVFAISMLFILTAYSSAASSSFELGATTPALVKSDANENNPRFFTKIFKELAKAIAVEVVLNGITDMVEEHGEAILEKVIELGDGIGKLLS